MTPTKDLTENYSEQLPVLQFTSPGPNPSIEDNPENLLYEAWRASSAWERSSIEASLSVLLRHHASKVVWLVLHSDRPDLVNEIVSDAMMELHTFREESAFSTWFHSRALHRCRNEYRSVRRRRESSSDVALVAAGGESLEQMEARQLAQQFMSKCTEAEEKLIVEKFYFGRSDEDIAALWRVSRGAVQKRWAKLLLKLRALANE